MSYLSWFNHSIDYAVVDLNKVQEFHEFWKSEDPEIDGFENVELRYDQEDGNLKEIIVEVRYADFSDHELFAYELSKVLRDGCVTIYFVGEDDSIWGYKVFPDRVKELIAILVDMEDLDSLRKYEINYDLIIS